MTDLTIQSEQFIPLSLYIHVPWCIRKCPYCDFWSLPVQNGCIDTKAYMTAIMDDLQQAHTDAVLRPLTSIFLGGGTPSLLPPSAVEQLINWLDRHRYLNQNTEITMEANPGTLTAETARAFASAGINRLSLGAQTFSDTGLKHLGRIHSSEQTKAAIEAAMPFFPRFSIDLMYGYPQQTETMLETDLQTISDFGIAHVSLYQLTIEPDTPFGKRPPILPSESCIESMEVQLQDWAAKQGYIHYETSAFAQPEHQCKHNLHYWLFGDYLGIGPGAHGKLTDHRGVRREIRQTDIPSYYAGNRIAQTMYLTTQDRLIESLMNAGRLYQGFHIPQLAQYAKIPVSMLMETLQQGERQGFWTITDFHAYPTEQGKRYLNQFLQQLMPDF